MKSLLPALFSALISTASAAQESPALVFDYALLVTKDVPNTDIQLKQHGLYQTDLCKLQITQEYQKKGEPVLAFLTTIDLSTRSPATLVASGTSIEPEIRIVPSSSVSQTAVSSRFHLYTKEFSDLFGIEKSLFTDRYELAGIPHARFQRDVAYLNIVFTHLGDSAASKNAFDFVDIFQREAEKCRQS